MLNVRITGLDRLAQRMKSAPATLEKEISHALGRGLMMAETEAKRRTPVSTGNLRSSIGGSGGYRYVRGLVAGVGTNVKYAFWVEVRKDLRHKVGEWGFMQKGAKASVPFIQSEVEKVAGKVAAYITT